LGGKGHHLVRIQKGKNRKRGRKSEKSRVEKKKTEKCLKGKGEYKGDP